MASSDFTNIRIESTTPDSVTIRYSYGGSGDIALYRATSSGGSYSVVQSFPAAYGSYPSPIHDVAVTQSQQYFYKFSDDGGSTFSSIYDVTVQKLFADPQEVAPVSLPSFSSDEEVNAENMDNMRQQVETYLNGDAVAPIQRECQVCPVDGALVLDCADGCFTFVVKADDIADVNSISINCDRLEIHFDIPEGTTTEICGFPPDSGFNGDECFQAPASSPIQLPIVLVQPEPCPVSRIRYGSSPCQLDYIYECWSKDSVRQSGSRDIDVTSCACGTIDDGIKSKDTGTITWTMVSGKQTGLNSRDHKEYAGISIYYKKINANCSGATGPKIIQYDLGGFGSDAASWSVVGKPIFGFALNVPENVTMRSFSGNVLLFDYPNSRFLWGSYSSADLLAGAMPTVINTMPFATITPTHLNLIIDATATNLYSDFDVILETNSDTQTLDHTSISVSAGPFFGFGLIWVANAAEGDHRASLRLPSEVATLWWG